ncbi:pyridoxal phosphate-dependent transferase [Aspergillus pseudoustus]|uniref:Pyridoxal phosphate-dependent transferase n=1 Tax=Aspergillus pseudoustus TaxID=1810923 RepID=A0ABR4IPW9_9EURO
MVNVKKFEVEQASPHNQEGKWMDEHETWATHNLAETCCASVSLQDLIALAAVDADSATATTDPDQRMAGLINYTTKQTYGSIRGSSTLRSRIADLYDTTAGTIGGANSVLITNGAIQANFLTLYSLLCPGDHVIVQYPTYQQLYSVPESLGAEVSLWKWRPEIEGGDGSGLDVQELRGLIRENTRMIILNNPQNPTGAVLSRRTLEEIISLARAHNITIHSDEVYRPLFHSLPESGPENGGNPPSILELGYGNVVATGSLSKAFSLAGIRVGWLASPRAEIIDACASSRHYTTISVSQVDDGVAAFALAKPTVVNLLRRNVELARRNLALLAEFVDEFKHVVSWVKPAAGTTAFIRFRTKGGSGEPVDDVEFCKRLQERKGVMFVPGRRCFGDSVDFAGYVRVGFVPEHQVMVDGLRALREFMAEEYDSVPAAAV